MDETGFSFASYSAATDEEPVTLMLRNEDSPSGQVGQDLDLPPALVQLAKRIKSIRESRAQLLDPSLFGEPAWNILLALYVAMGERYALSISALCAESGVPDTTATRSIKRMLELEMVRRVANPGDNRSTYIELTRDTAAKLTQLLGFARSKYLADWS